MENEVKEPAPKYNFISPEEYLRMERASDEKHEYYDGYIQAMGQGASKEHIRIETNIIGELHAYLKNKECEVMTGNMKVTTPTHSTYMYPDGLIVCGEPEWQDERSDTLANPSVVFEILSPSTQRYDKTRKFLHYQHIPSLKEFILIESRRREVVIARVQQDGAWRFEDMNESATKLFIRTINFNIPLDDVYNGTGL